MGTTSQHDKGTLVSEINVTPMVDVMLVLLIIFMVIAPMLQPRIRVSVPKARNPDLDMRIDKETSLVLAALDDGRVYLNREQISAELVQDRVTPGTQGQGSRRPGRFYQEWKQRPVWDGCFTGHCDSQRGL